VYEDTLYCVKPFFDFFQTAPTEELRALPGASEIAARIGTRAFVFSPKGKRLTVEAFFSARFLP
jgi:hypothetical protein